MRKSRKSKKSSRMSKFGTKKRIDRQLTERKKEKDVRSAILGLIKLNPHNYSVHKKEMKLFRENKLDRKKLDNLAPLFRNAYDY